MKCYLDEDAALMLRVVQDNVGAFETLYRKYLPVLCSYLASLHTNPDSIESLAHEVFLRVWRRRKEYELRSAVLTYLLGFAKKVAMEDNSARRREIEAMKKCREGLKDRHSPNGEHRHSRAGADMLAKTITGLGPKAKQSIELFYFKGLSYDECAAKAGCSIQAFEGRLRRARRDLKSLLDRAWRNDEAAAEGAQVEGELPIRASHQPRRRG